MILLFFFFRFLAPLKFLSHVSVLESEQLFETVTAGSVYLVLPNLLLDDILLLSSALFRLGNDQQFPVLLPQVLFGRLE